MDSNRDNDDDGAANGDMDISGRTVMLLEADGVTPATDIDGNPVAAMTTDANGNYQFTNLAAGQYVVMFEAVPGKEFVAQDMGNDDTDDSDVNANGKTVPITVGINEAVTDVDAGARDLPGSVSGTYFMDSNRDDDDDGAANGDMDLTGRTVMLLEADGVTPATDIDGNPVAAVTTDTNGNYQFTNVAPGQYVVMFEAVPGKEFVAQDMGNDDTDDSDVDANGKTVPITVGGGQAVTDVDAGARDLPGSVSGTYFMDANRDDDDDGAANGDMDLAGRTVMLLEADGVTPATDIDGNPVAAMTTDANGNYQFTNLAAGQYVVMFEAVPGKEFVAQDMGNDDTDDSDVDANGKTVPITVGANEAVTDVDAGARDLPGSVSGTYFMDSNRDDDDDGAANGDMDLAGQTVMLLEADGVTPATDIDGNPVAAVTTDANGNYQFTNVAPGQYVVMFEAVPGKEFVAQDMGNDDTDDSDVDANGKTVPITVGGGQAVTDVDAGARDLPSSVSGTYFMDANRDDDDDGAANGDMDLAGRTVMLLEADGVTMAADIDGNPISAVVTDAQGNYQFTNLAAGQYVVMFAPVDGKEFVAQDMGNDDTDDSDVNANGKTVPITVDANEAVTDVDAGARDAAGSLSGTYFMDTNRDNDDDGAANGDTDIAGRTVMLFEADGTTPATDIDGNPVAAMTTDTNGNYQFTNLAAGQYVVMFEAVDGTEFIDQDMGNDDTDDSDVGANGKTGQITVNPGEDTPDNDAGVRGLQGSISGRYFCDQDNNGVDDSDPGLEGLTVTLLDMNGDVVDTAMTLADGSYSFDGLSAGDYSVRFEADPEGRTFTAQDAGTDDTLDSDADPITGETATFTLGVGQTITDIDAGVDSLSNISNFVEVTAANTVTGQGFIFGAPDTTPLDPTDDVVVGTFESELLSVFDVTVNIGGNDIDVLAYCVDFDDAPHVPDPNSPLTWTAYDTRNDIPNDVNGNPIVENEDNLDLINKILNTDFINMDDGNGSGTNYDANDIQLAVWKLLDNQTDVDLADENPSDFFQIGYDLEDIADADEIIQFAIDNGGEGFVPGAGEIVGVVLESTDPDLQPLLIGIEADLLC